MGNTYFSRSELEALRLVGEFNSAVSLSKLINKSMYQSYRVLKSLVDKKVLEKESLGLVNQTYLKQLVILLKKYPNLVDLFQGAGIMILLELYTPKKVKEVSINTKFDEQTVYKVLQKAKNISFVTKNKNVYVLNTRIWPEAVTFFLELSKHEMSFDERVPQDSIIYHKSNQEILFSNLRKFDGFELTAFSVFEKFGVKVFPLTNYYYLPKNNLSKEDVFKHALLITNKEHELTNEWDLRYLILLAVFAMKNNIRSSDPLAKKIKQLILGNKIEGFPSREELREKALVYGVNWQ